MSNKIEKTTSEFTTISPDELTEILSNAQQFDATKFQELLAARAANPVRGSVKTRVEAHTLKLEEGFPPVVPPRSKRNFTAMPPGYFRGEDLICEGAEGLYVVAIFVGKRLQMPMNENSRRPFSDFTEQAAYMGCGMSSLKWDTCQPALTMCVTVENDTDEPLDARVEIRGKLVVPL